MIKASNGSTTLRGLRAVLMTLLAGSALISNCAYALITVGPDSDTTCQFHDVTSAVEAADQSPGVDLVAISSGTYVNVSTMFVTASDDLIVEGGFANCSAGISTGASTLDAAGAVIHGSLFTHIGTGRLTLLHLVLTNGDAGAGGGVDSEGSGALTLSDVSLFTNYANYGGGLFVGGNGEPHKVVTLVGVRFNSNTAHGSGGGMYARDADITIASGGESYFLGNLAQGMFTDSGDGGGFYTFNSNFIANTHSVPGFAFIGNNIAQRYGGGAYFGATIVGNYEFFLSNDSASNPLDISYNGAQEGGAVYMKSVSPDQILSFADFHNTVIHNNDANYGAVASIDSNGQNFQVYTGIRFDQSRVGDQAPPCATGLRCNTMFDNIAHSGSIISASASGPQGGASVEMFRGSMLNNDTVNNGGSLIFGGNARLYIDGSLFAHNTLSGDLMDVVQSELHFANSTVGYNLLGADQLFTVAIVPASLEILHSLLVQPNDPVNAFLIGTSVGLSVHDVGANNVSGLPTDPGNNVQFLTDPFVNAAQGDFHILQTSSAVDRWAYTSNDPNDPAPTLDLDGAARPHVFNSPSTPYDFGAYEAGAISDAIFINGFDL